MKTRDLRKKLFNDMDLIIDGKIAPSDGRNIVSAANQINISLQTELKSMKMQHELGQKITAMGDLDLD